MFIEELKNSEKEYRKTLSNFRSYLKIVETSMSEKKWNEINYETVPSRANLIYGKAFLRNDEERRKEYLNNLKDSEVKINAGTLFPHDIVHKYMTDVDYYYNRHNINREEDVTLEELWKTLPDHINESGSTICVADGSYSMTTKIGKTNLMALEVANALAIYFSERCSGQFKDKYITFSENPQLVNFSNCDSLKEKIQVALRHNECANTNIEKVFDLILYTAINNHMKQEELPQNILILSDMEFDNCTESGDSDYYCKISKPDKKLFKTLEEKYEKNGYKIPRLVFWNICSRTGTIPVRENDLGVALVSGFSPIIATMVLSGKTDPFECLLEKLNEERYKAVEDAIKNIIQDKT